MQSKQSYKSSAMHLIPQCIANWSGIGVSSIPVQVKMFPSHEEEKERKLMMRILQWYWTRMCGCLFASRQEARFPQVRVSSYLSGRSHGYLKAYIFVAGTEFEIWWATFQEIKATNKIAFIPFSALWERLMDKHYCDWQGRLPGTRIQVHTKAATSQFISLICQSRT